jgi:hypothetical protein
MGVDKRDYSSRYNTPLSESELGGFEAWATAQSAAVGRDIKRDLYDYDLQGWFKDNPGTDLKGGHLTDKYKKPNHPTFSQESQYHGMDGEQGGRWAQGNDGAYSFQPGTTNLKNFSKSELSEYFEKVEKGNSLLLPAD